MGVLTPNRLNDPVTLESYSNPTNLLQESGLWLNYFNSSTTLTLLAGEPVVFCNRICIVQKSIFPQKMGTVVGEWIVDALLDPAYSGGAQVQGALVYWDLAKNAVIQKANYGLNSTIPSTTYITGIGAATFSAPTNGFILGRLISDQYENPAPYISSNALVCANTGVKRIRVASIPTYAPFQYAG